MAQQNPAIKNAVYRVGPFPIYDSSGNTVTGAVITSVQVSKDMGTYAAASGALTEVASASGTYFVDMTAAEMNADVVAVKIVTASYGTYIFTINTAVSVWLAAGGAMTLTPTERNDIAAALLDLANGVEAGVTLRQAQRAQLAALAGKLSGAAGLILAFRNVGDTKDRIIATVDVDDNRSAVALDLT